MKNIIKKNSLLAVLAIVVFACSGSDDSSGDGAPPTPNEGPSSSQLVYPSANLLCIDNTITFEWTAATDPESNPVSYDLIIARNSNLTTEIVEQVTVSGTMRTITLEREVAYYWRVTPKDNQGALGTPSPTYAFYTQGTGVSNYAPFAAVLNAPAIGVAVNAGTTTLDWTGSDVDTGDTLTYDLYFGDASDPTLSQSDISDSTFDVTTVGATTYYWRVDTKDNNGVKTIGQEWTFSTN